MRRILLLLSAVLLLLILACLLLSAKASASVYTGHILLLTPTPTPDPNEILARASDNVDQANNLLNVINTFSQMASWGLAIIGIAAACLGFFGFSTLRDFRKLEKKLRKQVDNTKARGNELQTELTALKHTMERQIAAASEQFEETNRSLIKRFEETNRALTYLVLGNEFMEQRKTSEAIEIYEKARRLRPDDPQINYVLGKAYFEKGAYYNERDVYDTAVERYQKAIEADPDFSQAYKELGLVYRTRGELQTDQTLRMQDYEKAIGYLQHAITLRDNNWEALGSLGGLYRRIGDYKKSLHYYKLAYEIDQTTSYGPGNIACLSWYLGDLEGAHSYYLLTETLAEKRIAADRSLEPFWDYYDLAFAKLMLAEIEKDDKRREEALKLCDTAIALTPSVVPFDGVLSNLYLLQKSATPVQSLDIIMQRVEDARARFHQEAEAAKR